MISRVLDALSRWPKWLAVLVAACVALAVAALDATTGSEIRVFVFYYVPIGLVVWCLGARAGVAAALTCTFLWLVAKSVVPGMYSSTAVYAWNSAIMGGSFLFAAMTLAELRRLLAVQTRLARHDQLTDLLNHAAFGDLVADEVHRARRVRESFAVVYVDLDEFKSVNDVHGHGAGDDLLRTVARTLRERLRTSDRAARLGGDEFALLLPGTDESGARKVVNDLAGRLGAVPRPDGAPLSCSIGAAVFPEPPPAADAALRAADELMYEVKRAGKGAVLVRAAWMVQTNCAGRTG